MPVVRRRVASLFGVLIAVLIGTAGVRAADSPPALQPLTGGVVGLVLDETGAPISGAAVTLRADGRSPVQTATGTNGRFSIPNVPAGACELTVAAPGFAERSLSCTIVAGEAADVGDVRLRVAVNHISVDVTPTVEAVAEQQIKEQEQQRVFGIVPNFFITFNPDAAPLNPRQKFQLAWKTDVDPMRFAFVALVAGIQQSRNDYSGFGDGVSGYAKRYAAAYATSWTGTMITRVLLPSVLHQDPRYFYKGTGSTTSRLAYALTRSVLRKGDNGRWQPSYSGVLGTIAAAAISNYYYPEEDRRGARLILTNTTLGVAGSAVGHVAQEFLYARFTTRHHERSGK